MIILTFISDPGIKIPHYTYYCIKALRHYNPDMPIHFISNVDHGFGKVFDEFNVEWFDMNLYESWELEKFNETCDLKKHGTPNTTYQSPPNFFYGAMARLFYIGAHIEKYNIQKFYHLENDVLVYYPFENSINESLDIMYPDMGINLSTFSIVMCLNSSSWSVMLKAMLEYIDMGENLFCSKYNVDMFNEMTAGDVFKSDYDLANDINDTIYQKYFFDPGSCGQYLGGTNNGHGAGWCGRHHYIGEMLMDGFAEVYIKEKKPMIKIKSILGEWKELPLFNLHIHSKKLEDFIDV